MSHLLKRKCVTMFTFGMSTLPLESYTNQYISMNLLHFMDQMTDWFVTKQNKKKLTCSPSLISNPAFGMSGYIINQSVSCSDHVLVLQNILLCVCRGEAICLLHVWHEVFPEIPPGEAHTHPYGYKIFLFLSLNTLFDFIKCCAAYYNSKWNSIVLTNFVFIFFLNATT